MLPLRYLRFVLYIKSFRFQFPFIHIYYIQFIFFFHKSGAICYLKYNLVILSAGQNMRISLYKRFLSKELFSPYGSPQTNIIKNEFSESWTSNCLDTKAICDVPSITHKFIWYFFIYFSDKLVCTREIIVFSQTVGIHNRLIFQSIFLTRLKCCVC